MWLTTGEPKADFKRRSVVIHVAGREHHVGLVELEEPAGLVQELVVPQVGGIDDNFKCLEGLRRIITIVGLACQMNRESTEVHIGRKFETNPAT
jgi:hypothetical protein